MNMISELFLCVDDDMITITTATHRRTVRKVRPNKKMDLVAKYRNSEESKYVEKQTENDNIPTKYRRPKRWANYLKYHIKKIPYYIYSFFWQVS